MNKIRLPGIVCALLISPFLSANISRADSFDDAVNQFLKGFEYCKEAKSHLGAHRLGDAQKALQQYHRILQEATGINRDILNTSKRGMDGNLKYCERVARDVEVEMGMPTMDKALAECDAAQQSLKDDKPEDAKTHHENFKSLRDQALKLAPSLDDIFTVKNQISRCDRIEAKIASFSQKQKALTLSVETAREESNNYLASCQRTLENLKKEKVDDPVIRDAKQGLSSTLSHKNNVNDEVLAYKAFEENPKHPAKAVIDRNLRQGDRCVGDLTAAIEQKNRELAGIKQQFDTYGAQLKTATASCQKARKGAAGTVTEDQYNSSRSDYEKANRIRAGVQGALAKDSNYGSYDGWESVRDIEKQMQSLNSCMGDTKTQLSAMYAKIAKAQSMEAATKPASAINVVISAAPTPAKVGMSSPETAAAPALTMHGTLRVLNVPPEFALFYVPDDSRPKAAEIIVDKTGFDSGIYFTSQGETLSFKNKDNTTHRLIAGNDLIGFTENMVRLQPRQNKSAKVTWPANTIVSLRSDRGTFPVSYIANITSANYQILHFNGAQEITFTFKNDSKAASAYLLMPDTDPLTFTLNQSETKSLAISRDRVPVGSLLITGE